MLKCLFALLLIKFCGADLNLIGNRTVKISGQGTVIGRVWKLKANEALIFKGIPYAEPPLLANRFQKPKPKSEWSEPIKAFKYEPACIQFMDYHQQDKYAKESMEKQSENCLYLNVFAPKRKQKGGEGWPVVVWIHGGSFLAGSADTGIDERVMLQNVVFKGIIVVTINYRLGPFGFLSSNLKDRRGNFGLWDQIEALKWVNKYISLFGGDPDQVTIMGESAGGASVSILALSPFTERLVNRAIIMSGSIAAAWAVQRYGTAEWDAQNLIKYLNCEQKFDPEELRKSLQFPKMDLERKDYPCPLVETRLECASSASRPEEIWDCISQADFNSSSFRRALTMELGISHPVIDDELVSKQPKEMLEKNPRFPIMTGIARLEWGHKRAKHYRFEGFQNVSEKEGREKIRQIVEQSYKALLEPPYADSTMNLITNATYWHYIRQDHNKAHWQLNDFIGVLRQIESDIEFVAPCYVEASFYSHYNSVYLYTFEHTPKSAIYDKEWEFVGLVDHRVPINRSHIHQYAFHGLDHAYLFTEGYTSNNYFSYDQSDHRVSQVFSRLIANFIKYGDPNQRVPPGGITWETYSPAEPRFMRIRDPIQLSTEDFYWKGTWFWTEAIPSLVHYSSTEDQVAKKGKPLTEDDQMKLAAYQRAWWALWILVACIAFALWTAVVCLVARRCINSKATKPYKNVILTH